MKINSPFAYKIHQRSKNNKKIQVFGQRSEKLDDFFYLEYTNCTQKKDGIIMVIQRKEYLDKLIAFKDKQLIKVLTGIRRCGKSTLLEIYQNWLLDQGIDERQIISINFEDIDFEELTDYRKLYEYLKKRLVAGKVTYIFLDEIQHVEDFPKVVDSLYIKKNVDIYITGSNAYMLSSEIATLISGRYVQIEMLPFSFKEYMESTGSMTESGESMPETGFLG